MPKNQNRTKYSTTFQIALAGYLIVLIVGTHLPPDSPFLPREHQHLDKLYHFLAYALLGGLLATTWQLTVGVLSSRHLWLTWIAVAVVGAVDEFTQLIVGRDCEFSDWAADVAGALVGILIFVWLRRSLFSRTAKHEPQ
jgi:VanZ family protein